MKQINLLLACFISVSAFSQNNNGIAAQKWVDSVFSSLSNEERISQLMVIRAHSNLGPDHIAKVTNDIQKYNVGALCFFQGGPIRQANLTNFYQSIAKTPLMITIDAEWGLGMRLDSVIKFPYQLTIGAINDQRLVYEMGVAVGEQCKRIGVHVNYAPVVDINNNPANPVIGFRSFGEDKNKVAQFGIAYMKGMQDAGIMACAKHFPGHGDVAVDSHLDLPVINKTKQELDSTELMPFREIINAGIGSVMVAHLSVPILDSAAHRASSISKSTVTGILRDEIGFQGLTFTDALEMKGVAKYFPGGVISVEALIAGNDMLCLPEDVGKTIEAVKNAIDEKRLSWGDINSKLRKVLLAKYNLGLSKLKPIETNNLLTDLNAKTNAIRTKIARQSITVLKQVDGNNNNLLPVKAGKKVAYIGIGCATLNEFGQKIKNNFKADVFLFSWKDGDEKSESIYESVVNAKYEAVIIGIHEFNNKPIDNYKITPASIALWRKLNKANSISFVFGNVLASANYCNANSLIACYQDDNITQSVAADLLEGKIGASGKLPVRVCNFPMGFGIDIAAPMNSLGLMRKKLSSIDSIVNDAISQKAFPGCVVLAAKDGEIIYHKAFGHTTYDSNKAESVENIFDLASVTKVSATTISVMKLYEQGKLSLHKKIGDYLPWVKGSDKANLAIEDILLHQAGLFPFIPFYKETIDTVTGIPFPGIYTDKPKPGYTIRVAENIYMRNDWQDTMINRILKSPLTRHGHYVYSDNDFIFLGKIVEQISGMTLDQYVQKNFYSKMSMATTGFKPRERFNVNRIVPTETEKHFRQQTMQGDVHDEGASMFGGVAGHAGLFSDAYDLAMLYQMLLNGGELNGERYLQPETIKLFTAYHSKDSRRGYGFDKPEKDNAIRKEPYPSVLVSPQTFGHTGYTGTSVWVDPKYNLVYIFLSNRVNPTRNNSLITQLQVRGKIQDALIEAVKN